MKKILATTAIAVGLFLSHASLDFSQSTLCAESKCEVSTEDWWGSYYSDFANPGDTCYVITCPRDKEEEVEDNN